MASIPQRVSDRFRETPPTFQKILSSAHARDMIAAVILDEDFVDKIRRELRRTASGLKADAEEIDAILRNEIVKRDIPEGEEAQRAKSRVKRAARAHNKEQRTVVVGQVAAWPTRRRRVRGHPR